MGLVFAFHLEILQAVVLEVALGYIVDPVAVPHLEIRHLGIHGHGDVRSERPGRGGPHQQRGSLLAANREAHEDRGVGGDAPAFGHFHLREPGAAAAAPGHDVVAAIEEALVVALLEECPDGVIVLIGEGEVAAAVFERPQLADDFARARGHSEAAGQAGGERAVAILERLAQGHQKGGIVPIAPIAQADGLLGLAGGEGEHALFAGAHEILDAELANLPLGLEAQALFHFDFDPQTLAIEAVLIAQRVAVHGVIALVHILQRTAPGMVHAHGVVGGNGAVEERPARTAGRLRAQFPEDLAFFPKAQKLALDSWKIGDSRYGPIHIHWRQRQKGIENAGKFMVAFRGNPGSPQRR